MDIKTETNIGNTGSYKKTFEYERCSEYNDCYTKIICDFLEYAADHIKLLKRNYYYFVLQRGIQSLFHIFNILLLYTKNVDITLTHCNKALYYYIEFIEQIGVDSNSYLQLNSKDATLFIYKKTIYEISNDHRKNYTLDEAGKQFLSTLRDMNAITNEIILFILREKPLDLNQKHLIIIYTSMHVKKIMNRLNNGPYDKLKIRLPILFYFVRMLQHDKISVESFLLIYESFVKKIKKKNINKLAIKSKLYHPNNILFRTHYTPLKYVNWLFNN